MSERPRCGNCGKDWHHHLPGSNRCYVKGVAANAKYTPAAPEPDAINPPCYVAGRRFEVIDVIEDFAKHWPPEIRYHLGAVTKYLARCSQKDDPVQEIGKLIWYAERARDVMNGGEATDTPQTRAPNPDTSRDR